MRPVALSLSRVSVPAAGVWVGAAAGLADTFLLLFKPPAGLPWRTWVAVPWTFATLCCLAALAVSAPPLRRLAPAVLFVAGPGMVLLSRPTTEVKAALGLSTPVYVLLWAAAMLVVAVPLILRPYPFAPLRHPGRWLGAVTVSLALIVFCAAGVRLSDWTSPARSSAPPKGHRNVVLLFLDTVRYDDALADRSAMPSLRRFANSAVSFDNAWAPAPWTVPSHHGVLFGVEPWRVSWDERHLRFQDQRTSLAARFRASGYSTAAVVANPLVSAGAFGRGYDEFTVSRGAAVCQSAYGDVLNRLWTAGGPRPPVCAWFLASEVTSRATRFLRRAQRPYFLTLNYLDAHNPYFVPPECRDESFQAVPREERERFARAQSGGAVSAELTRRVRHQYRQAAACMDRSLAELFAALERDPDYASTTVVIVSDHGEQFGEHGLTTHGNSVHRPVVQVPLVVRTPAAQPARIADAVTIVDIYPTLLQLVDPRRQRDPLRLFDSQRRLPAVSSFTIVKPTDQRASRRAVALRESGFSIVVGSHQFIRWEDGREALFDAHDRPVALSGGAIDVAAARALIARERAAQRGPSEFNALGYLQ